MWCCLFFFSGILYLFFLHSRYECKRYIQERSVSESSQTRTPCSMQMFYVDCMLTAFCVNAWYQHGPAEAPAIHLQLWSKSYTHKGNEACRSVSTPRVCSWAIMDIYIQDKGWGRTQKAQERSELSWADSIWKWKVKMENGDRASAMEPSRTGSE